MPFDPYTTKHGVRTPLHPLFQDAKWFRDHRRTERAATKEQKVANDDAIDLLVSSPSLYRFASNTMGAAIVDISQQAGCTVKEAWALFFAAGCSMENAHGVLGERLSWARNDASPSVGGFFAVRRGAEPAVGGFVHSLAVDDGFVGPAVSAPVVLSGPVSGLSAAGSAAATAHVGISSSSSRRTVSFASPVASPVASLGAPLASSSASGLSAQSSASAAPANDASASAPAPRPDSPSPPSSPELFPAPETAARLPGQPYVSSLQPGFKKSLDAAMITMRKAKSKKSAPRPGPLATAFGVTKAPPAPKHRLAATSALVSASGHSSLLALPPASIAASSATAPPPTTAAAAPPAGSRKRTLAAAMAAEESSLPPPPKRRSTRRGPATVSTDTPIAAVADFATMPTAPGISSAVPAAMLASGPLPTSSAPTSGPATTDAPPAAAAPPVATRKRTRATSVATEESLPAPPPKRRAPAATSSSALASVSSPSSASGVSVVAASGPVMADAPPAAAALPAASLRRSARARPRAASAAPPAVSSLASSLSTGPVTATSMGSAIAPTIPAPAPPPPSAAVAGPGTTATTVPATGPPPTATTTTTTAAAAPSRTRYTAAEEAWLIAYIQALKAAKVAAGDNSAVRPEYTALTVAFNNVWRGTIGVDRSRSSLYSEVHRLEGCMREMGGVARGKGGGGKCYE